MPASSSDPQFADTVRKNVSDALAEDIGEGDLTAALVDGDAVAGAQIIARDSLVVAGQPWADEVFRQLDAGIVVDWYIGDGQSAEPDDVICKLVGNARALLTGERTALNFLQTLSATATATAGYVQQLAGTRARLLDTRKTLPGLRLAQKYAVRMGGGYNHRAGLFDAILIKENHIRSAGGIGPALRSADAAMESLSAGRRSHEIVVEVEVESLDELVEALAAGARRVMLDNFSLQDLSKAVALNAESGPAAAALEASGNIGLHNLRQVAGTGVDYISVGAITKNVAAADLSMLFRMD